MWKRNRKIQPTNRVLEFLGSVLLVWLGVGFLCGLVGLAAPGLFAVVVGVGLWRLIFS